MKKGEDIFLSVVIPSYNEVENIKNGALLMVKEYLEKQDYTWEVIVNDDASPIEEARKLAKDFCDKNAGFVFVQSDHGGKAITIWGGIQKAKGKIILMTDMDQSAPIAELGKLLPFYDQNYDLVIGSRGVERKNFPLYRKLASAIFREFRRSILLRNISDTQCGFKTLKRDVALDIFPHLEIVKNHSKGATGWSVGSWDAEMLYIAEKYGYKIKEIPVSWENRDLSAGSKKSNNADKFIKESLEMLQQIFRVRINDIKGYYKK